MGRARALARPPGRAWCYRARPGMLVALRDNRRPAAGRLEVTKVSLPVLDRSGRVVEQAEWQAREARPWIDRLGRLGHVVIGVVYIVIGLLASQAARGDGGATIDQDGALNWMVEAPLGRFLLAVIALG